MKPLTTRFVNGFTQNNWIFFIAVVFTMTRFLPASWAEIVHEAAKGFILTRGARRDS